jgi:hypothetical protein
MKRSVIEDLTRSSRVPRSQRGAIARELRSHVEETRRDLMLAGWDPDDALHEAENRLGDGEELAQAFAAVYRPSRRTQLGLAMALATGMLLGLYGIGGGLASATAAKKHQIKAHPQVIHRGAHRPHGSRQR